MMSNQLQSCKSCGGSGEGKYCCDCGQAYHIKRITVKNLLHDVFHFFTHLEKGFGYTVKQLFVAPGTMQREFIEGKRARYQKPFSMFILCATINGLARYLILTFIKDSAEVVSFFHQYMILAYTPLIPFFALINWLFFYKKKYNYAETGVLLLYMFSFIFLLVIFSSLPKLIWIHMDTAYIDYPLAVLYSSVTLVHFYRGSNRWVVLIKNLVLVSVFFYTIQSLEDFIIALLKGH